MKTFFRDIKNGLTAHYPLCCIIAFVLKLSAPGICYRNGNMYDPFMPCFFHSKNAISDREYLTVLNNGDCSLPDSNFDADGNYNRMIRRCYGWII